MSDHSPAAVAPRNVGARRLIAVAVALVLALAALTTLAAPREASAAGRSRLTALTTSNYATAMLRLLNSERHSHRLRPLTMNWRLRLSAHRHDLHMAGADTLSHQLPGEAFFATRISNAGYHWSYAAENIGCTTWLSKSGLLELERIMYNEHKPDNGHRLNILSTQVRQVGIDVYYDAKHHKIWFTQDFGAPR